MKKRQIIIQFFLVFCISSWLYSFQKTTSVSIKAEGFEGGKIWIENNFTGKVDTLVYNKDKKKYEGNIKTDAPRLCNIYLENIIYMEFPIYIEQGVDLDLVIDISSLKKRIRSVQILSNSNPNKLLYTIINKIDTMILNSNIFQVDDFEPVVNKIFQKFEKDIVNFKKNISKKTPLSEDFEKKLNLSMLLYKNYFYVYFIYKNEQKIAEKVGDSITKKKKSLIKIVAKNEGEAFKKSPIPESFTKQLKKEIPTNDYNLYKELKVVRNYVNSYIKDLIFKEVTEKIEKYFPNENKQSPKFYDIYDSVFLNLLVDKINNDKVIWPGGVAWPELKDDFLKNYILYYDIYPQKTQELIKEKVVGLITNPNYIAIFNKNLEIAKRIEKGKPLSFFSYKDINNKTVTSNDLKGKITYIDVWATWCGPCLKEIPFLNKLEDELKDKNINFVSISLDEPQNKKKWEDFVKKEKLPGIQLIADGFKNSSIVKDFNINGIPYFIIVDKNGNIVKSNASRPSDPETKKILLDLSK